MLEPVAPFTSTLTNSVSPCAAMLFSLPPPSAHPAESASTVLAQGQNGQPPRNGGAPLDAHGQYP